jgi:hypothetical protein
LPGATGPRGPPGPIGLVCTAIIHKTDTCQNVCTCYIIQKFKKWFTIYSVLYTQY